MNRTKRFLCNSISTAILQIITMFVGFIIPRVMLKGYGSEINGLVSSITQFIAYFNLVEAGLASAAIYALYKPLADNDYMAINKIVSAAKRFYTQSGYIFLLLILGLAIIYPCYIKSSDLSPLNVGLLVVVLGINGCLEFFTLSKYRVLLTADQKTYIISLASTIHIIINTIIIVVLTQYKVNIVLLRLIALVSIILRTTILMLYCKRQYKYLNYEVTPDMRALDKRWDALILQILGVIQSGAPVLIITILLKDLKLISVYTIFNMVISGINSIFSIFVNGLSASFGDVIARGQKKVLQRTYKEFEFIYYTIITIVYSITFVTIMSFIDIYTKGINDINYNRPIVGFLFVLNGLLYNIKTPQGMLVISAGMYKETKRQTIIQALIALIVGIILAPFMGISGVLIGGILSNLYRDIDLIFFIPKNLTKLSVTHTIFRVIRIFANVTLVSVPFLFINISPKNIFAWMIYACKIGVYALVVVGIMAFIFERNEIRNILQRIKGMGGKRK